MSTSIDFLDDILHDLVSIAQGAHQNIKSAFPIAIRRHSHLLYIFFLIYDILTFQTIPLKDGMENHLSSKIRMGDVIVSAGRNRNLPETFAVTTNFTADM